MRIAITGGIGSGKSTVRKIIAGLGGATVDADAINAKLLTDADYLMLLTQAFPYAVDNGVLNKRKLATAVFSDVTELSKLNAIARPALRAMIESAIYERELAYGLVFAELPLLYEWGMEVEFNEVWVVLAKDETRIARVKSRNDVNESYVRAVMSSQTDSHKGDNTVFIENDGDLDELQRTVKYNYVRLTSAK